MSAPTRLSKEKMLGIVNKLGIVYLRGLLKIRFIRFLFVGALNTLFGYTVFALLLFIGLHYAAASLVATIFGIMFNFKTTGTLVFRNPNNRLLVRFVSVYLVTYLVNVAGLKTMARIGMQMYCAGAIMTIPVACLSFLLLKIFVFRDTVFNQDCQGRSDFEEQE